MKRFILLIGAILLGLAARAQSVTYTCRYWFDQNHAQATTTTFGENGWEAELDVGNLTDGLHALHLHVLSANEDSRFGIVGDSLYLMSDTTLMKWSAPQTYLFLKLSDIPSGELTYHYWFDQNHAHKQSGNIGSGHLLLDVADLDEGLHALHVMLQGTELTASQTYLFLKTDQWDEGTPNYVYHCWFDEDFTNQQADALGTGHLLLDVADLEEGMHTVHVMLEGTSLTSAESYLFMKVAPFATDSVDMSHLAYHCWFDQDFEHRVTDSLGNGNLLLDVSSLDDGLHTVHVLLEGSTLTATQSYMFMKMPVEDPTTELQYICWFDQDYSNVQTGLVGSGLVELDVADLPNGIHTVNVQLDNGTRTAPQTYLFYKQPLGGYGVARWEYWINDDFDGRTKTILPASVDTLDIVSLLPVGHPALRSSCFHFHPNGEEPYINAKNQISFRIWDAEMRFMDMTRFYVDEQVRQDIVAQVFERNTSETFAAPRDNQIQWFKLDAVVGDSLSFIASKACTMQLFAPSGEEVFNVSGPESIILKGLHAWEDGTYYLAVHDMTGSGEQLSVTYNWVYRYAILAYDVHLVGNGGCSTITFNGNGYNSLLDVYLVNAQNDTIRPLDIGHESNSTTTVTFNFYGVNLGVYDAVFEFYDETMMVNNALEVQEPVDIVLTSTVSYPSTYLRSQGIVTYTYSITNNGNMTAYAVPIYVFISTASTQGISSISIEGLDLPSIVDGINTEFLTETEIQTMYEWANSLDDMYCFNTIRKRIGNEGDSITVRSNYFFLTMAPYETKTINIKITSDEIVNVQTTIPDELPALVPYGNDTYRFTFDNSNSISDWYCCIREDTECFIDVVDNLISHAASNSMDIAVLMQIGALMTALVQPEIAAALELAAGSTALAAIAASVLGDAVSLLGTTTKIVGSFACDGTGDFLTDLRNALKANYSSIQNSTFGSMMDIIGSALLSRANGSRGDDIGGNIGGVIFNQLNHWQELYQAAQEGSNLLNVWLFGSEGIPQCIYKFGSERPGCPPQLPKGGKSTPVVPRDPNDIRGYLSESGSHYMRQEIQNVQYEIEFENDTTLATAAAHTIIVRDTLDASKFDLNSLAARSVTIGDKRLELNGEQTFARTLDLRPEIYVIAQIEQDYDPATGIVEWTIQSLDPMTMEPTDDPNQGVLPVNYNGDGVGFIDYSIDLKEAFADGTEISNRAGIIFDQEEVIMTPTWTNTVDAVKPTSHIEEVTPVADSLSFNFVSEDNRSGVWYHSLYYRNDSTQMQWQVKKPQITENNLVLFFDDFQTTEYLVIAVDSAGNVEEKEMVAEYTYYYEGPGPASQTNLLSQGWNWWSTYVEMNNVDGLGMLQNSLGHNGQTIKSQNDFTDNYYQDMGEDYWYGSLESIQNEQGYLINVADACSATMTGSAAIPALHPITIQPNWNWIGYPVAVPQTVASALAGFTPMPDDVVKGQSDFTSYYEGFGWYPDDFMLVPGQSYLYFSTANAGKMLTYASGSRGSALKSRKLGTTYWNNNVHAYADNLSVMAVVTVDSIEQRDENLELGAFVNGECRGSVRLRYFALLDRYYAMLTVSGQDGDLVGFRLIHSESLEENETCSNHLVFSKNAIVGSLGKPYEIRFSEVEDAMVDMVLYPNPVERGATFSLMIPSGETVTEVIITDVVGNQLRHETGAINAKSIKGLPTAGVYVIKAVAKSGNTYHGRLIVE